MHEQKPLDLRICPSPGGVGSWGSRFTSWKLTVGRIAAVVPQSIAEAAETIGILRSDAESEHDNRGFSVIRLIEGLGRVIAPRKYRCLFSVRVVSISGPWVSQRKSIAAACSGRPVMADQSCELVTMTLTTMAAVAAPVHVAPERPGGCSAIAGTQEDDSDVPLPGAMTLGFEAQQLEHPTNVTSARRRSKSMPGTWFVAFIRPWDDTRRRIVRSHYLYRERGTRNNSVKWSCHRQEKGGFDLAHCPPANH